MAKRTKMCDHGAGVARNNICMWYAEKLNKKCCTASGNDPSASCDFLTQRHATVDLSFRLNQICIFRFFAALAGAAGACQRRPTHHAHGS
ncbi:MAG: hypothetical protein ACK5NS_11325 [Denitromonas sp.]